MTDINVPDAIIAGDGQWFYPDTNGVYGIYGDKEGPSNISTIGWTLGAAASAGFKFVYKRAQQRTDRCEVCGRCELLGNVCDNPKNGYCAIFRFQAAHDAIIFGMHPSIHTKAKEEQ